MLACRSYAVGAHVAYAQGQAFTVVCSCVRDALQLHRRNASGGFYAGVVCLPVSGPLIYEFSGVSVYFRTMVSVTKSIVLELELIDAEERLLFLKELQ